MSTKAYRTGLGVGVWWILLGFEGNDYMHPYLLKVQSNVKIRSRGQTDTFPHPLTKGQRVQIDFQKCYSIPHSCLKLNRGQAAAKGR